MTQRERTLATVVGATAVVVLGLVGVFMFKKSIDASQDSIRMLQEQVEVAKAKIEMVRRDEKLLQRWRRMSLVGDPKLARAEYRQYLDTLFKKNGLKDTHFPGTETQDSKSVIIHPTKPGKLPIYHGLGFTVKFQGTLGSLVTFLKEFQSAKRMHRIKQMTIERAGKGTSILSVTATFEALMILDADKAGAVEEKFDGRFVVMDTLAALTNGITGLGAVRWTTYANSTASPNLMPLNMPHTARDYLKEIASRNFWLGPTGPPPEDEKRTNERTWGDRWADDMMNLMRFTHFGAITNDGKYTEAMLWDQWNSGIYRMRASGGFNKFPMLQGGQSLSFSKIIQGTVIKIENSSMVFRVTLQASDATYVESKWWRYPPSGNFFEPHPEDFATLVKMGKVREIDRDRTFIVPALSWERMTRESSGQITLISGGPMIRLNDNGTTGDIIHSDKDATVLRLDYDPPGGSLKPAVPYTRFYPDDRSIYRVSTKHFSDLVADKNLPRERTVKPGDIERVFVTRSEFWDELIYHRVLREEGGGADFKFYNDLIGGEILTRTEGGITVFRIWEDYCHCRGFGERNIKDHWHPGFLVLNMDEQVQDAVWNPWAPERVKEYLKSFGPAGK